MASTTTLGCFKCSELAPGHPCPNSNNDPTSWKTDPNKYSESRVALPLTSASETCSVIVGKSGRIYHQGFVSKRKCTEQAYITRLAINIGRKFQDPSSQMKCCNTSGCNWSWDAAARNQGLVSATDTTDSSLLIGFIGVISLGLIILLGALLCCFIFFWRKKNEDSKDEMLYFPRSTYDNKRQQDSGGERSVGGLSMYDRGQLTTNRYTEIERGGSGTSSPPISRGSNRISVREADMYNYDFKDKWEGKKEAGGSMPKKYTHYDENGHRIDDRARNERYTSQFDSDPADSAFDSKYNNVDKDWIDVKSNNYFSNEEFQDYPSSKSVEPEEDKEDRSRSEKLGGQPEAWFVPV